MVIAMIPLFFLAELRLHTRLHLVPSSGRAGTLTEHRLLLPTFRYRFVTGLLGLGSSWRRQRSRHDGRNCENFEHGITPSKFDVATIAKSKARPSSQDHAAIQADVLTYAEPSPGHRRDTRTPRN
jgi:hypothetical protein